MDLVSVVFPVYNIGENLRKSVQSILNQTYRNIEVILIDDGSKDNSLEICNSIAEQDSRVKVVHTENQGSGPARNTGVDNAKGRYIYFPDADDYVAPNAIEILVNAMIDGCDLVVFGFRNMTGDGTKLIREKKYVDSIQDADTIRKDYYNYLGSEREFSIQGAPWNKFFTLDVIKDNGVKFPPLRRHQDEAFIGRYMCYAKKVHFIEDVLYDYYTNDLQKEWQKYPKNYIDAVTGLYAVRKETILTWNPDDAATHDSIKCEFICKTIKAFELSFSPKMELTSKTRKQWLSEQIKSTGILEIDPPAMLGKYQTIVMKLIKKQKINLILFVLKSKVTVERLAVRSTIRR